MPCSALAYMSVTMYFDTTSAALRPDGPGQPGARAFRRHLATRAVQQGADVHVLREALAMVLDTNLELAQTAAA